MKAQKTLRTLVYNWYRHFAISAVSITAGIVHMAIILATNAKHGLFHPFWPMFIIYFWAFKYIYTADRFASKIRNARIDLSRDIEGLKDVYSEGKKTRESREKERNDHVIIPDEKTKEFNQKILLQANQVQRYKNRIQKDLDYLWTLNVIHKIITGNWSESQTTTASSKKPKVKN